MVKQEKPTVAPKSRPPAPAKPEPLKTPVDAYVLLMPKGTDFRIHKTDCKSYKAQKAQSSYKGLQDYKLEGIVNQLEVIRDVWDDQIREQWEEEHADPEDPEKEIPDYGTAPWSWLNANGYVHSVEFHTCLNGLPQQAKGAAKTANTRKLAKTELATLVAEAAGQMLEDLLGANLADPDDPYARAAEMITSGFKGDDEIRQCVAQWLHGLPCDRDRWVAAGMAIPDRSDWAGFAARRAAASDGQSPEEATDELEEDTAPAMDGDEDVELPTE
jgi:hypothetical protein